MSSLNVNAYGTLDTRLRTPKSAASVTDRARKCAASGGPRAQRRVAPRYHAQSTEIARRDLLLKVMAVFSATTLTSGATTCRSLGAFSFGSMTFSIVSVAFGILAFRARFGSLTVWPGWPVESSGCCVSFRLLASVSTFVFFGFVFFGSVSFGAGMAAPPFCVAGQKAVVRPPTVSKCIRPIGDGIEPAVWLAHLKWKSQFLGKSADLARHVHAVVQILMSAV